MNPKRPLRSSKDIYDRMRWDASFPSDQAYIGYMDRMTGFREIPFADFRPGGRIPWDRIVRFRMGEKVIWDRKERIDLVFGSGESDESDRMELSGKANWLGDQFVQIPWFRFSDVEESWTVWSGESISRDYPETDIVSWNILMDDHQPWRIQSHLRYPRIFQILEDLMPAFIALQEVQLPFLRALLLEPWVRENYFISDSGAGETLDPYGQLLMTRIPPESLWMLKFKGVKKVIVGKFNLNGRKLMLPVVHLTSSRQENAPSIRKNQMETLARGMTGEEVQLWTGDFNFGDGEGESIPEGFVDVWTTLHPDLPGYTFDPGTNDLAAVFTETGRPRRLDRMIFRDDHEILHPEKLKLLGTDPLPELEPGVFPSDHFGLYARFSWGVKINQRPEDFPVGNQTAVAIIPPEGVWNRIQGIRRLHDPSFERWMPHINLLYGFVPEHAFELAGREIEKVVEGFPAFELNIDSISHFRHSRSATLWMAPERASVRHLRNLQKRLTNLFPQCTGQNRNGEFRPHLTIAKLEGLRKEFAEEMEREFMDAFTPFGFFCGEICLISREKDTPFRVVKRITLLGGDIHNSEEFSLPMAAGISGWLLTPLQKSMRKAVIAKLDGIVRSVSAKGGVFPAGSEARGTAHSGSDLDLICRSEIREITVFRTILEHPDLQEGLMFGRILLEGKAPLLKMEWCGIRIDLQYMDAWNPEPSVASAGEESGLLRQILGEFYEPWQEASRIIGAWAYARQLTGAAFGMPAGLVWSILVAETGRFEDPEDWVKAFFSRWLAHDWRLPVAAGEIPESDDEIPAVFTTAAPRVNLLRNQIASLEAILETELLGAAALVENIELGEGNWEDIFQPANPDGQPCLSIEVSASSESDLEVARGWVLKQMFGFLQRLELVAGPVLRPYTRFRPTSRLHGAFRIGFIRGVYGKQASLLLTAADLEQKFRDWEEKPSGGKLKVEFLGL